MLCHCYATSSPAGSAVAEVLCVYSSDALTCKPVTTVHTIHQPLVSSGFDSRCQLSIMCIFYSRYVYKHWRQLAVTDSTDSYEHCSVVHEASSRRLPCLTMGHSLHQSMQTGELTLMGWIGRGSTGVCKLQGECLSQVPCVHLYRQSEGGDVYCPKYQCLRRRLVLGKHCMLMSGANTRDPDSGVSKEKRQELCACWWHISHPSTSRCAGQLQS